MGMKTCPTCKGTGHISYEQGHTYDRASWTKECPRCDGRGKIPEDEV